MILTLKDKAKHILQNDEALLIGSSLIFGLIFSLIRLVSDDAGSINNAGNSIASWWRYAMSSYNSWTSRQLINFVVYAVLKNGRLAFSLYMALSMYIMLKAMSLLFADSHQRAVTIYIICTLLTFPFVILTSAGWICTSVSYFGPQAYALMALVPIKYTLKNQIITWKKFIFFCLCLIYAANLEQICVFLLILYAIATIYFFHHKKNNLQIWILFFLTIFSLIYIMTCPGNRSRGIVEIAHSFPTYNMLTMIDKADIGLSTTFKWLLEIHNFTGVYRTS